MSTRCLTSDLDPMNLDADYQVYPFERKVVEMTKIEPEPIKLLIGWTTCEQKRPLGHIKWFFQDRGWEASSLVELAPAWLD